ncbi:hypothetical protein [Actomonas aquatica]|uniref:Chromosome partition protein Smc n=1 Tax=Actomonas aquatica TaxID=2866162 RepID=A0ABZ1C276_9BACT|nr:hypothetical protein [Opitutus sp. WL0086]WRQ85594.1 hypothetical protein K1X11_012350 [Opitutus sp. WL0086]
MMRWADTRRWRVAWWLAVCVVLPTSAVAQYKTAAEARVHLQQIETQIGELQGGLNAARATRQQATARLRDLQATGPETPALRERLERERAREFDPARFDRAVDTLDRQHWDERAKSEDALAKLQAKAANPTEINARVDRAREALDKAERLREQGIRELQEGYYCSQCNRPASQIEDQTGNSFQSHLRQVSGRAIPASAEVVARKTAEFDRAIEQAKAKLQEAEARRSRELAELQQDVAQQQQAHAKLLSDYRTRRSELIDERDTARRKLERERDAEVKRLQELITRTEEQHKSAVQQQRERVRVAEARERELDHQIDLRRIDANHARWGINFYGGIEARQAAQAEQAAKREAERELREAKRLERQAELAAQRAARAAAVLVPEERRTIWRSLAGAERVRAPERESAPPAPEPEPVAAVAEPVESAAIVALRERARRAEAAMLAAQEREAATLAAEQARVEQQQRDVARAEAAAIARRQAERVPRSRLGAEYASADWIQERLATAREKVSRWWNDEAEAPLAPRWGAEVDSALAQYTGRAASEEALAQAPAEPSTLDRIWERGMRRLRRGTEVVREHYRKVINSEPEKWAQDFIGSESTTVSSRLNDVMAAAGKRLHWRSRLRSLAKKASVEGIARLEYTQRTGEDFDELSGFEQDTERVFAEARIITPPRDYLDRLYKAYERTANRYAETFGWDEDAEENDE